MTATARLGDGSVRRLLRSLPVFAGPLATFEPAEAPDDPASLFITWLTGAIEAGMLEPHAAVLSTVTDDGHPSGRVLICKDIDAAGTWFFASSARSRKGREIATSPHVALTFYWPALGRQVRVEGRASSAGAEASAQDFLARPLGSRAEALTDRQSDVLTDPGYIEPALQQARSRLEQDPELVAPHWTLYGVTATAVEFWQADPQRRHTRLRYQRPTAAAPWETRRLWP